MSISTSFHITFARLQLLLLQAKTVAADLYSGVSKAAW